MSSSSSLLGPLSDLVARCVLAYERDGDAAVDRELLDFPELAGTAREQLAALQQAGLLLPPLVPESIGPYRVVRRLGIGGMGTVWLCEQEHPVRRQVAVKVMRPGLDHAELLVRFRIERQALALLQHPGVARVLDAGVTDDRRPYLVMDYVAGTAVTQYCDARQLGLRARLELFAQICDAVQHAHHKGIIHRDLKPSNVLVVDREGVPFPVVIDFGVAKSLGDVRVDATLLTLPGRLLGTPEYMSPEQAQSDVDVDTRTDIYSLGVLLYELLTGELPIESAQLRNLAELARVLAEVEPKRPSVRVAALPEAALRHRAAARIHSPVRLVRALRGELDWIVGRAIEKDRTRRYGTAAELAQDVRRYLAEEPVQAGPPSRWYVVRKFVARHRVPVGAMASLGLLLILATTSSLWFWREAAAAERTAVATTLRLEQSLDSALVALDRIVTLGADGLRTPENEAMRRTLLRAALDLHEQLIAAGKGSDARLLSALARGLARAAGLNLMLGEREPALAMLARSEAVLDGLVAPASQEVQLRLRMGQTRLMLGEQRRQLGDLATARRHFEMALAAMDGAAEGEAARAPTRSVRIEGLRALADIHTADDTARAEQLLSEAKPLAEAQLASDDATRDDRVAALLALARLAWLQIETRDATTAAATLTLARTSTAAAMRRETDLVSALAFVGVLEQMVSVAVRLRLGEVATETVDTLLGLLRRAVQAEPAVARHRTSLGRALKHKALLTDASADPAAVEAMEREGLALEEQGLAAAANAPPLAVLLLGSLLEYASTRLDWLPMDAARRATVDLARVEETLQRAERIWLQLPEEYRRDRHTRESWTSEFMARAGLAVARGDLDAACQALGAGEEFTTALLAEHPGVVQVRLIRAQMRHDLAALLRQQGRVREAWPLLRGALDDLAIAAPTFTEASRFTRFDDVARLAARMTVDLAPLIDAAGAELADAAAATCAAIECAKQAQQGEARSRFEAAAVAWLAAAIDHGWPREQLAEPRFAGLRELPEFRALQGH